MDKNSALFPSRPNVTPTIYAYSDSNPQYSGLLKVGYTEREPELRIAEQYEAHPIKTWKLEWTNTAMRPDGSVFMDHELHAWLKKHKYQNIGGEWFACTIDDIKRAYIAVRDETDNASGRTESFGMRPEQKEAVNKTKSYFENFDYTDSDRRAKFLWNCKMRFGKTFATYELAKAMNLKRILVLTFKPAVESAWHDDLVSHVDFEGWQFISRDTILSQTLTYEMADKSRPIVCFGSFQDFLQRDSSGSIKTRNKWVHEEDWDLVVFDEYHYGAWRDKAKHLFDKGDQEEAEYNEDPEAIARNDMDSYDETWLPITTKRYLFLSGTPFRALNDGEFLEDQIYSWTYSDEQRAKNNWRGDNNPYAALPQVVMMVYQLPPEIENVAKEGEFNEFNLNEFFKSDKKGRDAQFIHKEYVQKWLDLIRGQYLPAAVDDLKLGKGKPKMPFSDVDLLGSLQHTLWFLPDVASCYAMKNLLMERQNSFYHDYNVVVCAGNEAGMGASARNPVDAAMAPDPLEKKSITLTCGKLTTGVTVKPWGGIFMLRNLKSPETYFQAAFRVQSPWTIKSDEVDDSGKQKNIILKKECYVFDFALNRSLQQLAEYGRKLDVKESNPEKKLAELMAFLPALAYKDGVMVQLNAESVLEMTVSGTTATLLARRWENALLVNVDNDVLNRLLGDQAAMDALSNIEGFRNLNNDIQTIINKSNSVKDKKKRSEKLTPSEKRELTEEEKEYRTKRKEIQQKLLKFAARIPVFMYLTDYRENSLQDVIRKLEPKLFKKVTGLETKDFDLLLSLGLFNEPRMNDAVYGFRRYEEGSLDYSGINRHIGEGIGGFAGALSRDDYERMFNKQQESVHTTGDIQYAVATVKTSLKDDDLHNTTPKNRQPKPKYADAESLDSWEADMRRLAASKPINKSGISIGADIVAEVPTNTSNVTIKPSAVGKNKDRAASFDPSSVTLGGTVYHKAFGAGKVTKMGEKKISVYFSSVGKTKDFLYPSAFKQGYLNL